MTRQTRRLWIVGVVGCVLFWVVLTVAFWVDGASFVDAALGVTLSMIGAFALVAAVTGAMEWAMKDEEKEQ